MQVFVRAKICPDPCKRGLKAFVLQFELPLGHGALRPSEHALFFAYFSRTDSTLFSPL